MDAIEALRTRRSVWAYKADPVDKDAIETIVDCGRLAATAINIQPWEFVVVTDPALRKRIAATTDHGPFIADAPVCIVVLSKDTKYYVEDGCAATQNIPRGRACARARHVLGSGRQEALCGRHRRDGGRTRRPQAGEPDTAGASRGSERGREAAPGRRAPLGAVLDRDQGAVPNPAVPLPRTLRGRDCVAGRTR